MSRKMLLVAGIAHATRMAKHAMRAGDDDRGGFFEGKFIDDHGVERRYFRIGEGRCAVMVLHELFGLSPGDLDFCRRLAAAGFTVYAPVLFGDPGKAAAPLYQLRCFKRVCVSHEFAALAWYRSSPVADSLRAFGRIIYAQHGEPGFGVIGLCLTGNFALVMMADEHLVAPVLGEPALPFALSKEGRRALGLSDDEIACVRRRITNGSRILGYRFRADRICSAERFEALKDTFKEGFEGHCIESSARGHHSVFAEDYDENSPSTRDAFLRLVAFLNERFAAPP